MLSEEIISNLDTLIPLALMEDLGNKTKVKKNLKGDITTEAIEFETVTTEVSQKTNPTCTADCIAKEDLLFCGKEIIEYYLETYTQINYQFEKKLINGKWLLAGEKLFSLFGNSKEILKHERIILNFLQYLCGIATKVYHYKKILAKTNIMLLDTRKTLPGYRALAKYAVKMGGGENHRQGLFDHYLIKDNHITSMKNNITKTVAAIIKHKNLFSQKRDHYHWQNKKIIVECATIQQIKKILPLLEKIDQILLDNMSIKKMESAITLLRTTSKKQNTTIKIEASGNIDEGKIKKIKHLDLDYISIGALTHSIQAKDISLEFKSL